jgi:hypothetical protein
MKALSLTEPWASLVMLREKQYETRSWRTHYRGPIAIHSAKGFPQWARVLLTASPFFEALMPLLRNDGSRDPLERWAWNFGCVLATARLVDCVPTKYVPVRGLFIAYDGTEQLELSMTERERIFGNYEPMRWVWILDDVNPLEHPVRARGRQGLWNWDSGDVPPM